MEQDQDKFVGSPKCPSKVPTNTRSLEIHKLKHENPESTKKNTNENVSVTPKFIQFTRYPDISKNDNLLIDETYKKQDKISKIIQKLITSEIITIHWYCKFCELLKFDNKQEAKLHVHQNHVNLTENDIIGHIQVTKGNKVVNKWICKVCGTIAYGQKKVARCYKEHGDLFNNISPQLKSQTMIISLLHLKYTCLLCKKELDSPKVVKRHISQKHVNIFSEYFCSFEAFQPTESQSEHYDGENIIVKNLMEKIGITIYSKTSRLQSYKMRQQPKEVYNCALCPHTIIFLQAQIPFHMWSRHTLRENYDKLVTSIPINVIMDSSKTESNIFNCPCQYTSFSREILSMPAINMLYTGMPNNSTADNVNAESKLMQIYKSQFICHSKYKLIISSKCKEKVRKVPKGDESVDKLEEMANIEFTKEKSNPIVITEDYNIEIDNEKVIETNKCNEISAFQPTNNEITDEILITNKEAVEVLGTTEDSNSISEDDNMDIFKLLGDEATSQEQNDDDDKIEISLEDMDSINQSSKNDTLYMKDLLKKAGITDENSITQSRIVYKVPNELYSCFLCPHLTIFSSDDLKFHMNKQHNLTEDYSKLISVVPVDSLIEKSYENVDEDLLILTCLCKHASFTKEALSMPVIERTYEGIIKNPEENENIDSEMKLLRIYQYQFTYHYKQKLTIMADDEGKKQKL